MKEQVTQKRKVGDVAFATFDNGGSTGKCSGEFHFTQITPDTTRITGQFNTGFTSTIQSDYTFIIVDKNGVTKFDFTKIIRSMLFFYPPGTAVIQFDPKLQTNSLVGLFFVVKLKGTETGRAQIKGV
ncbi:7335_t:CDS:2 [Entrophospora sp. SA101]|nr:7335_t:CDS:2 [Entrophospora sp. SA101]